MEVRLMGHLLSLRRRRENSGVLCGDEGSSFIVGQAAIPDLCVGADTRRRHQGGEAHVGPS